MYASEVDDKKLTFFVSGQLWGRSLVMGDKETDSLWSHILGKSMAGPMKGKALTIIPARMTTWQDWLEDHPDTTVTMIPPTDRRFTKTMLHRTEDFCMGLIHDGKSRHWRFDLLFQENIVNDQVGDLPVVVAYDRENASANVWSRKLKQRTLTFERIDGTTIIDRETKSQWDLDKGVATAGPMAGTQLDGTTAIVSFIHAWMRFHPDSTRWEP